MGSEIFILFALFLSLPVFNWAEAPNQVPLQAPSHSEDQASASAKRIITPEFSEYIQKVSLDGNVPGISLGLVHPGGEVELGAWGKKSEDEERLTPDTLFNLASCSKAFLASSVGILMDDFANGKNVTPLPPNLAQFDWNTKVVDLLPGDWKLDDKWVTEKAKIRDILSHVSGLPRHDYSYKPGDSPLDVIRRMRHLRTAFELRQKWSYNNQMYMTGAHIVSTYSGAPYTEFAKKRIFEPLNMSFTTFSVDEATKGGKLTQSWTKFGRRLPFWMTESAKELQAGAGGVISSVEDMMQWLKLLLNEGVNPSTNVTVIPKSVFEEITTAHAIVRGKANSPELSVAGYGMGWFRQSYRGHEFVWHTGGIPGFSTLVAFFPFDNLGFVALANADEKAEENYDILYRVIEDYFGLDRSARPMDDPQENDELSPLAGANPSKGLTLPLEAYTGTYTDPGYGNITLCSSTSTSPDCAQVLQDFAPFEDFLSPNHNIATLYASFPRIWASHIRLTHSEEDTFNMILTYLFPEGYGKDKTPYETWESGEGEGTVRFVVEKDDRWEDGSRVVGLGLSGTVGEITNRERRGGSVEDVADVWFVKL